MLFAWLIWIQSSPITKVLLISSPLKKKDLRDAGKNPDETLISPNDGLAYGIVWGLNPQSDNSKIMVFEKKGKDGKRQVVDMRRNPFYLTEEEFKKAPFPNGFDPEK